MPDDTTRTSNRRLNSGASEYNAISFMVEQMMKGGINTAIPVRVDSCTKPGPGGAAGYVSATPLVMQRGADGNSLAPVSLPKLPFFRLYAGTAAVVIDPQPGDVGLAIFSQQDASNLEAGKNEPVQAGSFRSFDMSDGFYIGGFLGNVPDVFAELEQDKGITLQTPSNVITIDRDGGNITISAKSNVTVIAPVAVVDASSTTMTGNVEIGGTLTTGGLATFKQGLRTTGGSSATISGNVSAGGDISADGDFSGGGGLTLGGDASIGGTLDAVGAATFGSTLETTGAATFASTVNAAGAATFGSTLETTGAATFRDTLEATGAATFESTVSAAGAATFGSTLAATGAATFESTVSAAGAATFESTVDVTGELTASSLTITGNLRAQSIGTPDLDATTIRADSITTDSISSAGTLQVNGDLNATGSISAGSISAGDINASGTISGDISGSGSIDGDLAVTGAITAQSISVESIDSPNGILSAYCSIWAEGGLTAQGQIRSETSVTAPLIQQDPPSP